MRQKKMKMNETLKELLYVGALVVGGLTLTQSVTSCAKDNLDDLKVTQNKTLLELEKAHHELDSLNAITAKRNYEKSLLNKPDFYMKQRRANYDISNTVIYLEKK